MGEDKTNGIAVKEIKNMSEKQGAKNPGCCECFEIPYSFGLYSMWKVDAEVHKFYETGCNQESCFYLLQKMFNFLVFSVMAGAIVLTCKDAVLYMQTENFQRNFFFKNAEELWVKIAKLDSEEGDRCSLNSEWKFCKHNEMCENPQDCEKLGPKFIKKQEEQKSMREEKMNLAKEKANAQKDTTNKKASNTSKQNVKNASNSSFNSLPKSKELPNVNLSIDKSQPETTFEDSMTTLKISGICAGIVFLVLLAATLIFLKIFYLPIREIRNENCTQPGFLNKEDLSNKKFILLPELPPSDEQDPGDMHEIEFSPKAKI